MAEGDENDCVGECVCATDNRNPWSIPLGNAHTNVQRASDLLVAVSSNAEVHKPRIHDLSLSATEEIRLMAQEHDSLWLFHVDNGYEVLNQEAYNPRFASLDPTLEEIISLINQGHPSDLPDPNGNVESQSAHGCASSTSSLSHTRQTINFQGSRAKGVVFRNPISIVNMFMDVDKWSATFSNIVSKAINVAVLATGDKDNPNGCLQVMFAEFHISSPVFKPQQMYFARHSRQINDAIWVVSDVSLETIFPSPVSTPQRRPSGIVIQALQDGVSTVTWVEHNAQCKSDAQSIFKGLLESGIAFNAKRWITALERQCDRIASLQSHNDNTHNDRGSAARNGLLKLADRMVRHFNFNIRSNTWRLMNDDILIKSSFNLDDQEIPNVSIATSVRLPVSQNQVFEFLRNEHNRTKWDILSFGLEIQDVRVSSARNSINSVSVISVESCSTRTAISYLQESFSDSLVCYVVYAPIDIPTMQHILQGGSVESVAIMPCGFVILPDGSSGENSILTVAFQIMDEQLRKPEESMLIACTLINQTLSLIRTALNLS